MNLLFSRPEDLERFPNFMKASAHWVDFCMDAAAEAGKPDAPLPCDHKGTIKRPDGYYSYIDAARHEVRLMNVVVNKYVSYL